MQPPEPNTVRPLSTLLLVLILVVTWGCCDSETRPVDFTETIPVAYPGDQPAEDRFLRVAVAAMISPEETSIYYHQMLDYIGGQLGKETELIQRKTYDEINELFGKERLIWLLSVPVLALTGKKSTVSNCWPRFRSYEVTFTNPI